MQPATVPDDGDNNNWSSLTTTTTSLSVIDHPPQDDSQKNQPLASKCETKNETVNATADLLQAGEEGAAPKNKFKTTHHRSEHPSSGISNSNGTPQDDDEDDKDQDRTSVKNEQLDEVGAGNNNIAITSGGGDDDSSSREERGGGPNNNHASKTAFPILLHEVVSDPSTDCCIHWLPCGTRFMISDKKKFAENVLPLFYGNAKFTSFTRRLKRWSFTRVPSGPYMGAYYNPNFTRDAPDLAMRVRYDHHPSHAGLTSSSSLRGTAIQLSKTNKLQLQQIGMGGGMGGMGMAGMVGMSGVTGPTSTLGLAGLSAAAFGMNPQQLFGSATSTIPSLLSNEEKEVLLRQMSLMNSAALVGGGVAPLGINMSMGGGSGSASHPNLEQLYRVAMNQQNAVLLLERLNQQHQQQQHAPPPPQQEMSIPNHFQQQLVAMAAQQAQTQAAGGGNFSVNSMPPSSSSLATSLAPHQSGASISGFNFAAAAGGSNSSTSNLPQLTQQQQQQLNSAAMNSLPGGIWGGFNPSSASPNPVASLLNYKSSVGGEQPQLGGSLGGGRQGGATTITPSAAANSTMMNSLLAEYLSRSATNNIINNGNNGGNDPISIANGVGGGSGDKPHDDIMDNGRTDFL